MQQYFQCVIPCGGNSSRAGSDTNKCLVKAGSKTILKHVVDFWRAQGIEDFIFIVGGGSAIDVEKHAFDLCARPVIVNRGETVNLIRAVKLVEPYINDKFVLALGDCVNFGSFTRRIEPLGVGVCIAEEHELKKSYLVQIDSQGVTRLVEKPPPTMYGLCGMGTLFLDRRIFHYIKRLSLPDHATSVDFTGALQLAIGEGETVKPILFKGDYINVTYPEDFIAVAKISERE